MKEIYNKLNEYLNEICNYLEKENSFLLYHIHSISKLNDAFLSYINDHSLDNKTVKNNLTFEDVYQFAREIIKSIDKSYLEDFDNLIDSGELDFSFDNAYEDSQCIQMYRKNGIKQIININREFNYNDVRLLIHEFIHYTNGKEYSINRNYLTEFLSIYFEFYAIDYLLKKGINKEEIDYFHRIKCTKRDSIIFNQYEIVLLAFVKFGNIDENTVSLLQKYLLNIKTETFEKECTTLYNNLCIAENYYKDEIEKNPRILGCVLSKEFITHNYRYILGTFLAIYAREYANFHDIVYLNNHINEYEDKNIYDICLTIGIDIHDANFSKKLFTAINKYVTDVETIDKLNR